MTGPTGPFHDRSALPPFLKIGKHYLDTKGRKLPRRSPDGKGHKHTDAEGREGTHLGPKGRKPGTESGKGRWVRAGTLHCLPDTTIPGLGACSVLSFITSRPLSSNQFWTSTWIFSFRESCSALSGTSASPSQRRPQSTSTPITTITTITTSTNHDIFRLVDPTQAHHLLITDCYHLISHLRALATNKLNLACLGPPPSFTRCNYKGPTILASCRILPTQPLTST